MTKNRFVMQKIAPVPAAAKAQTANEPKRDNGGYSGDPPTYHRSRRVPVDTKMALKHRCVCAVGHSPEIEIYKVLRTQIQHQMEKRGWNRLMVTSARPGEGKTVTAVNLAFTFSAAYSHTALLLDCDLRQQRIHEYLGIKSRYGLADHLLDAVPIEDILIWPGTGKLTVISGERTVSDSAECLGSPKMQALIREMKGRYSDRYLIFDTPPVLFGADAIALAPFVDGILMVVETGKTPLPDIKRALEMLPKGKVLGFAMNRQSKKASDYARYYRR